MADRVLYVEIIEKRNLNETVEKSFLGAFIKPD